MAKRRKKASRGLVSGASNRRLSLHLALAIAAAILLRWLDFGSPKEPFLDSEVEALARVIRSEVGICSAEQQEHVAWAVRNLAAKRRQSIAEMVCKPCGGQQEGRPVSSQQDAIAADRKLARRILHAPLASDPTGGATHFLNPQLQDQLALQGRPGYRGQSYRRVRKRWKKRYGWEPYYRLGATLEMWGVARGHK